MFSRRTFSAMLAGTVAALRGSLAQAATERKERMAFYSGVGTELTHYEVDVDADTLTKRGSVKMPGGIQYAWPHPSRKYLYVIVEHAAAPDFSGNEHHLAAFRVGADGELTPHGEMIRLRCRPIHNSVDIERRICAGRLQFPGRRQRAPDQGRRQRRRRGEPSRTIWKRASTSIRSGRRPATRPSSSSRAATMPEGGKPEDPGSLHVYGFKNGVLSNLQKDRSPTAAMGFGPRHLDIHPTRSRWVYLSVERQNKLIVYKHEAGRRSRARAAVHQGDLGGSGPSLPGAGRRPDSRPSQRRFRLSRQPLGRCRRRRGRASRTSTAKRCSAAAKATSRCSPSTSRPASRPQSSTPISTPPIRAPSHWMPAGRMLVAGSLAPTAVRRDGKVVVIPAGMSVFRMGADGKLDFVRKYDLDVGKFTQWWSGMIPLA